MSLMEQIYKQVIIDRSRRPKHRKTLARPDIEQDGVNPSCGDELRLSLRIEDGRIAEAAYEGHGCAISQAAADLMADALEGRTLEEAHELAAGFKRMIRGEEVGGDLELGDLRALEGIRRLHARVKCATLPFTTLQQALSGEGGVATEE